MVRRSRPARETRMPRSFNAPTHAHKTITDQIVDQIEAGAPDFVMPWHVPQYLGRPANALTAKPYRGINVVALWADSLRHGYLSGVWATYRQWSDVGAQVRKGSHGAPIVFYKPASSRTAKPAPDDDGDTSSKRRLILRTSIVFNQDQVEGWSPPDDPSPSHIAPHQRADTVVRQTGVQVRHGGHVAAYDRTHDHILMPEPTAFQGTPTSTPTEAYYATLLHELVHWTGGQLRLDRRFGQFGDEAYAFEELIAELGAAFLCADLGVTNVPRADHAAYIASWLKALKHDGRALFRAAALADLAAMTLLNPRQT